MTASTVCFLLFVFDACSTACVCIRQVRNVPKYLGQVHGFGRNVPGRYETDGRDVPGRNVPMKRLVPNFGR